MASEHSTGSRAILTASLLVALELFRATEQMLADVESDRTAGKVLGVADYIIADVRNGRLPVTMEDVTHWIANLAEHRSLPSLHGYTRSDAPGVVVSSLELLIRGG